MVFAAGVEAIGHHDGRISEVSIPVSSCDHGELRTLGFISIQVVIDWWTIYPEPSIDPSCLLRCGHGWCIAICPCYWLILP